MEGLKVNFTKDDISINTGSKVSDFDATVQNALVNIGTREGTDKIFAGKGTRILDRAVEGKIVGFNAANHESQLAAVDTLFFSREYETSASDAIKLGNVAMAPLTYDGNKLTIEAAFTNLSYGTRFH
jgi:hypothetical protein